LTAGAARPFARACSGKLEINDNRVFGPGGDALARRFARRVLSFAEVQSLALNPAQATTILKYRLVNCDPAILLTRLADAVAAPAARANETALPSWTDGEPVILYRHSSVISIFEELNIANGRLTARHPAMESNQALARRVEHALQVVPGVIEAATTEELCVRFDPNAVTGLQLIRIAEAEILGQPSKGVGAVSELVNFGLENVMVGVAAVGEFVLPLAAPVASGLLVLASLGTFGAAASQLRERRIGLPLLYTCALGARLSSGQFLAASLIAWFFRYWEYRYRQDVEVEIKGLIDDTATLPKQARVLTADGLARLVPRADAAPGQQVRVLTAERVPVDGRVLTGAALVDESFLGGPPEPVRRVAGDPVVAGSTLLAGALDIETLRAGEEMRAARVAQTLIEITVPRPHSEALNRDAEDFAGQTVAPTLLTASAGLVIGDVTTAGTILSPDYATGVGLAMPLERVRDVRSAIRIGAVIRTGGAFERLAKTSWFVLDEHEALHRAGCEVAEVRTKGFDEARLLPAMAAAGIWLGDERGPAIARACRDRGLVVRRAVLREIDGDGVAVEFGDRLVRLRGRPVVGGAAPPPLIAEVNGVEVAGIRFVRNGYLEAADAVRSLQRDGQRVFLASQRAAAGLADALGVDRYGEGMSDDDKVRVLRDLRQQGLAAAYVGDGLAHAPVAREAHLSISLGRADPAGEVGSDREPSDILLMSPSIAPLPALCALARDSGRRKERRRYAVMAPNLLCVAGAFAFGFTPMAAVLLSNFGTSLAYNGAKRALREAEPMPLDDAWYADDERTRPGGRGSGRADEQSLLA
jgi:cation transport ATPase